MNVYVSSEMLSCAHTLVLFVYIDVSIDDCFIVLIPAYCVTDDF